jgi:hypothetical protein
MKSVQNPSVPSRSIVGPSFPTPLAVVAIAALALGLGVHVGVWVNTARPEDDSILGLIPWLAYPGVVAAIAVRSRVAMLAIGVAVALPVAMFATLYGPDRTREMGIGVLLFYVVLLVISLSTASWFARRPGWQGLIGAIVGGAASFLLAFGLAIIVVLLPIYR